jgi:hypothetical protein
MRKAFLLMVLVAAVAAVIGVAGTGKALAHGSADQPIAQVEISGNCNNAASVSQRGAPSSRQGGRVLRWDWTPRMCRGFRFQGGRPVVSSRGGCDGTCCVG